MANPICATLTGLLEGTTFEGALEKVEIENIIERASGHMQFSTIVLPSDDKNIALPAANILGEVGAGHQQKLFLLVSDKPVDIDIGAGTEQYRVSKPVVLLTRSSPEVTSLQLKGVAGGASARIHVTKIVGAP